MIPDPDMDGVTIKTHTVHAVISLLSWVILICVYYTVEFVTRFTYKSYKELLQKALAAHKRSDVLLCLTIVSTIDSTVQINKWWLKLSG